VSYASAAAHVDSASISTLTPSTDTQHLDMLKGHYFRPLFAIRFSQWRTGGMGVLKAFDITVASRYKRCTRVIVATLLPKFDLQISASAMRSTDGV
jgi:hypothetical protein